MSLPTFARPPRYDAADARAYVEHITGLVGDRDPQALMADAPDRLGAAVARLPEADARRPEAEGKWSVLQILRHLADSEMVYGYRMRLIVADDRPAIPGYDQDAWASRLAYHHGTGADALADFAAQRAMTLRWLGALPEAALARVGVHSERGEESVGQIVRLLAGHDLVHEAQVRRVRDRLGA
ncbi:MAG: DinB family protein [Bacteroidota bacterium]